MTALGDYLGGKFYEQEQSNQSLVHEGGNIQKIIAPYEEMEIEDFNLVIQTRNISTDSIWGVATWNTDNWDGTYNNSFIDVVRRRWIWDNQSELEKGTADANIDLTNGDIRLAT